MNTVRVGLVKASLRLIEDPNRSVFIRLAMAFSPLLALWLLSPIDPLPEVVLGPLGLLDDGAILLTLFFLIRLVVTFYDTRKYVPARRVDNPQHLRHEVLK